MTRRRSSAPGRERPVRLRSLPWLLLPILVAFFAVGCIGSEQVRDEPSRTPAPSPAVTAPLVESTPAPTPVPEATVTVAPTEASTPAPTAAPPSVEPSPPGAAGSVAVCSGDDSNREFFANVAAAYDWPVYCPVLPARWVVETGQYRSAGGGWMEITYKGPGGARFQLREGAFCDLPEGCVPDGPDAGAAAFGDLQGTLVTADDGRYAVVVGRGDRRSWLAIGSGLDLEVFKGFAADLALVE